MPNRDYVLVLPELYWLDLLNFSRLFHNVFLYIILYSWEYVISKISICQNSDTDTSRNSLALLLSAWFPVFLFNNCLSLYFWSCENVIKKNSTEIQMLFNLIIFQYSPAFPSQQHESFFMKKNSIWGWPFFSPYLSLFFAQMSPAKSPRLKTKTDTSQNPLGFF